MIARDDDPREQLELTWLASIGAKTVLVDSGELVLPFDVVGAKIRVPEPRAGVVSRTALVNRLRANRDARSVAVIAPGGYGKTTLLSQWADRDDRSFAWV